MLWKPLTELNINESLLFDILKYIFLKPSLACHLLNNDRRYLIDNYGYLGEETLDIRSIYYKYSSFEKIIDSIFNLEGILEIDRIKDLKKSLLIEEDSKLYERFNFPIINIFFYSFYGVSETSDDEILMHFFIYRLSYLRYKYFLSLFLESSSKSKIKILISEYKAISEKHKKILKLKYRS